MDTERKYRKQINRNGWMANLYRYSTGREPKFSGYCPFFWQTWFWVLMFPLTCIGKSLEWLWEVILSFHEKEDRNEKETYSKPDARLIILLYETAEQFDFNLEEAVEDSFWDYYPAKNTKEWALNTPNWKDFYPIAVAEIAKEERKEKAREQKSEKRAELATKAHKYARWLVKPGLAASAIALVWGIYQAIIYLISLLSFGDVLETGKVLLGVVGVVLALWGIIWVMRNVKNLFKSVPVKKESFFLWSILAGIGKGIVFLFETVTMIYKKECPLIEWSDETKPIEKI